MEKKKILVIEDDEGVLDVMRIILEMYGYAVEVASDCSVVKRIKADLPDLLIMDIWMKDIDGRKICRDLKSELKTKRIPIIMVSATNELAMSAKKAGADDFLEKPFQIEDLVQKIKRLI